MALSARTLAPRNGIAVKRSQPGRALCRGGRHGHRGGLRSLKIILALLEALEKFVAFAETAHTDVLVLKHRFDNAEDRLRPEIVGAVKAIDRLKYLLLTQARVLKGALLKTVVLKQIGLVFLHKPAVLPGHFEQFGPRIGRRE